MLTRIAALTAALLGSTWAIGSAAALSVAPLGLALEPQRSSSSLAVSNAGNGPVTLSAVAYRWTQTADRAQVLTPTDDVVLYPHEFTLGAGEQRSVRVGVTTRAHEPETAYRIVVTELPADAAPADTLLIRTQLSVPLFVRNGGGKATVALDTLEATRSSLRVRLAAVDGQHAFVRDAAVTLYDSAGAALGSAHAAGWYILAGSEQRYDVALPHAACARVARVSLHVTTESGAPLDLTAAPTRTCGAP